MNGCSMEAYLDSTERRRIQLRGPQVMILRMVVLGMWLLKLEGGNLTFRVSGFASTNKAARFCHPAGNHRLLVVFFRGQQHHEEKHPYLEKTYQLVNS